MNQCISDLGSVIHFALLMLLNIGQCLFQVDNDGCAPRQPRAVAGQSARPAQPAHHQPRPAAAVSEISQRVSRGQFEKL